MGTYWYIDDPEEGSVPIYGDDIAALFSIAKQHGVKITSKMIMDKVSKKWKKKRDDTEE